MRIDNRQANEIRPIKITPYFLPYAEGSVLIECGKTKVICAASVDSQTPKWLKGENKGWVSAEYSMLPRSTHTRITRDKATNSGRSQEISRLIARSLRAAVDLKALGERQIMVDCDVVVADGGTRTTAINGAFVALVLALKNLRDQNQISVMPIKNFVSAISVGFHEHQALLDLCYEEDSTAQTDMNFVMTDKNDFIEIQGTAEGEAFNHQHLGDMIALAQKGCQEIMNRQKEIIGHLLNI